MANPREVFTILENDSTAEGVKLPARQSGDTVGGNHLPVISNKASGGGYVNVDSRQSGQSSSSLNAQVGLVAEDGSSNLKYIQIRSEGNAIGPSMPGLVAKDSSGNLAFIKLNSDGEVIVSSGSDGTPLSATAIVAGVLNTVTTVVNLALTVNKKYEEIEFQTACTFPVFWELVQVNDVTLTVVSSWITGAGMYSYGNILKNLLVTAGASGTQQLRIRGTQLQGPASDMHATVGAFQKA